MLAMQRLTKRNLQYTDYEENSYHRTGAGGSSKLVFDHGQRIERVENVKRRF